MAKGRKLNKDVIETYMSLLGEGGVMGKSLEKGGAFMFFSVRNNRVINSQSARFLIEEKIVKPVPDGLFADAPQTYAAIPINEFDDFKELYEQV